MIRRTKESRMDVPRVGRIWGRRPARMSSVPRGHRLATDVALARLVGPVSRTLTGKALLGVMALAVALAVVNSSAAYAACTLSSPTTWTLGSNGSWTVDSNWNSGAGPFPNSSGTNACIVDGTSTVTLSASVSVGSLQIAAGNALTINTGFNSLSVFGNIINAGTIRLNGGGNADGNLIIASSTVTLSGGGTLTMSAGGGGNAFIQGNTNTLINVDNRIQGVGVIGDGSLAVINGGTINANSPASQTSYGSITLNGSGGITNSNGATGGLLTATNGGTLAIQTTVNNAGGNITANGGTVQLNGATIQGGTLNNTAGGTLSNLGGATLDGSTHGALTISSNSTLAAGAAGTFTSTSLMGTITNQGTIQLTGGGNADGKLIIASDVTLNGGGTVTMAAGGGGNAFLGESSKTLTNVNNTIQGVGVIELVNLVNGGTINANSTAGYGSLTLTAPSVTNNGIFAASNGGTLVATVPFTNNGLVNAISGTINATQGFSGTTGTAQIDAAGTLMIGANSTVGTLTNNGTNPSALTLGTNNMTVSTAYNNANFGVGNTFNNHANVSGTGQILAAGNVGQAVAGANITNGTTVTPTFTIGNVHVGTNSFNYQVAATGSTGPSLLGAIQTTANGGNITDSRLGVTAGNWGPIAPGSSSGNLAVTYTAGAAGLQSPLSGQAVHIANNFDNVAGQTMSIVLGASAAAYHLAAGSTTPTPVTVANQRVGGTNSQALTVANTAPAGSFTEVLNASFGLNTGSVINNGGTIAGGLGAGGVAGGSSNNTAMSVGVDTSAAGSRSGTVTINYVSNGTGTSSLGNTSVGSQTITVSGSVYQLAAGQIQTAPLSFGTVQVGQSVSQNLVIRNTASGPAGFVEDLNAAFGSSTDARISGTGSLSGILAGTNSTNANGTMNVSINTSAAGTVNGSIRVNYTSAGAVAGVSNGLGTLGVGFQDYSAAGTIISGQVIDQAKPVINGVANPNPVTVDFGNVRINTAQNQTLTVLNQATGNPQAQLNAGIATNGAPVTASGSFTGLLPGNMSPGQSGIGTLQVGLDTSVAGVRSGSATVSLVSDASNVGGCGSNCQVNLPNQTVNVSANVYQTATGNATPSPTVNLGNTRAGGPLGQTFTVTNTATGAAGFVEDLNAAFGASTGAANAGVGSITGLSAGNTSTAMSGSLNSTTAGAKTGTVTLNYQTAGTVGGVSNGLAPASAGDQTITLTGNVYQLAAGQIQTAPLSFGTVQVGQSVSQNLVIRNTASGPAGFVEDLNAAFGSSTDARISGTGSLSGILAGTNSTNANGTMNVSINTSAAGTVNGSIRVNYTSAGAVAGVSNGLGTLGVGFQDYSAAGTIISGQVIDQAKPVINGVANPNPVAVDFGNVRINTAQNQTLTVLNQATGNPQAQLNASIASNGAPVTASGSFTGLLPGNLSPGQSGIGTLQVDLDTSVAGVRSGSATVSLVSDASNVGGCSPNCQVNLSNQTVNVNATVYRTANPQ